MSGISGVNECRVGMVGTVAVATIETALGKNHKGNDTPKTRGWRERVDDEMKKRRDGKKSAKMTCHDKGRD